MPHLVASSDPCLPRPSSGREFGLSDPALVSRAVEAWLRCDAQDPVEYFDWDRAFRVRSVESLRFLLARDVDLVVLAYVDADFDEWRRRAEVVVDRSTAILRFPGILPFEVLPGMALAFVLGRVDAFGQLCDRLLSSSEISSDPAVAVAFFLSALCSGQDDLARSVVDATVADLVDPSPFDRAAMAFVDLVRACFDRDGPAFASLLATYESAARMRCEQALLGSLRLASHFPFVAVLCDLPMLWLLAVASARGMPVPAHPSAFCDLAFCDPRNEGIGHAGP